MVKSYPLSLIEIEKLGKDKGNDIGILCAVYNALNEIDSHIRDYSKEEFMKDSRTKNAVCMLLIRVGEILPNLSQGYKELFTADVDKIRQFRNKIAHEYHRLDIARVWKYLNEDFQELKYEIGQLFQDFSRLPENRKILIDKE